MIIDTGSRLEVIELWFYSILHLSNARSCDWLLEKTPECGVWPTCCVRYIVLDSTSSNNDTVLHLATLHLVSSAVLVVIQQYDSAISSFQSNIAYHRAFEFQYTFSFVLTQ